MSPDALFTLYLGIIAVCFALAGIQPRSKPKGQKLESSYPTPGASKAIFCIYCRTYLIQDKAIQEHAKGRKHKQAVAAQSGGKRNKQWYEVRHVDELKT